MIKQHLADVGPNLVVELYCLLKCVHILLVLCKLGLRVVFVMEVLQASCCLSVTGSTHLG